MLRSQTPIDERIRALKWGEKRSRSGPATPRGTRDQSWERSDSFASEVTIASVDTDGTDVDAEGSERDVDGRGLPFSRSPNVRFRDETEGRSSLEEESHEVNGSGLKIVTAYH